MNVNVSYRHMESSPSLRDYAVNKLERICEKYVRGQVDANVVMTAEPFGHVADFTVSVKNDTVKGKAQSYDMYSSIDLALEKIEKQLRRRKDRVREHHDGSNGLSRAFKMGIVAPQEGGGLYEESNFDEDFAEDYEKFPAPEEERELDGEDVVLTEEGGDVKVVRNREYTAEPMSVEEAVSALEDDGSRDFYVFNNSDTDRICIVYRRDDDHIGLIETG